TTSSAFIAVTGAAVPDPRAVSCADRGRQSSLDGGEREPEHKFIAVAGRHCTRCEKTLRCLAVGETSVTAASEDAVPPSDSAAHQDGRLTRAARTRASVVEALLTLNDEGNLRPTARDIATKAGVSLRSLYVHFDDLEALFLAASRRQGERLAELL